MKKKLFALMMAMVMVLSLAACGGDSGTTDDTTDDTTNDASNTTSNTRTMPKMDRIIRPQIIMDAIIMASRAAILAQQEVAFA